ncbi:MAG: hypothetical protein O2981_00175 [Proteobacteria bacterium]|nr:hypothetical protein [Pseudomonadota bacterium]
MTDPQVGVVKRGAGEVTVKVIAVIALLLFLANTFAYDFFVDPRVSYPIALFLGVPILGAITCRRSPIPFLIAAFVPIGIFVGAVNTVTRLVEPHTSQAAVSPLTYAPLAVGLIASYVLRIFLPQSDAGASNLGVGHFAVCLLGAVAISGFYFYTELPDVAWLFLNSMALFAVLAVTLATYAYYYGQRWPAVRIFAVSGRFICLAAAVIGITSYTFAVGEDGNHRVAGPVVAESILTLTYGAALLIVASGCAAEDDKTLMTRDWHLAEAYIFVTLIIFPPLTLLEYLEKFPFDSG